jgi:hypothetical protein
MSTRRFILYNVLVLVFVKLILPFSTFQLANITGYLPTLDSREIISATNDARLLEGLSPLEPNFKLDLAAKEKIQDMADNEYFAHISPEGIPPWTWIKNSLYDYIYAGENLAMGFSNSSDVVDAWLGSPSHRANILSNKYDDIGVAVGRVNIDGNDLILVVQMFGTPVPSPIQAIRKEPLITVEATMKELPVKLQYVSTDETIDPLEKPIKIIAQKNILKGWQDMINNIYIMYAAVIAFMSVMMLWFKKKDSNALLKASFSIIILTFAIIIPVISITVTGLIF